MTDREIARRLAGYAQDLRRNGYMNTADGIQGIANILLAREFAADGFVRVRVAIAVELVNDEQLIVNAYGVCGDITDADAMSAVSDVADVARAFIEADLPKIPTVVGKVITMAD